MNAQIGVANREARDWLESSTGFSFPSSVASGQPIIKLTEDDRVKSLCDDCNVLDYNEYVACRRGRKISLYLRDGVVCFDTYESEISVTPIIDTGLRFPQMALEAALSRAFLLRNSLAMHALVLDYQGFGVLALGVSGAGKTTLALAGLAAGAKVVSDDRVLLQQAEEKLVARSMRPFLQIRPDTLRRFPSGLLPTALDGMQAGSGGVVRLARRHSPETFVSSASIQAIVLLSAVSRGKTVQAAPADHAQVLSAIIGGSSPFLFSESADPFSRSVLTFIASAMMGIRSLRVVVGTSLLDDPVREFNSLMAHLAV